MCNKEQLVAYLYDDLPAGERATVESHAARCAACRDEIAALRGTRQHLAAWAPPDPGFDLRGVRRGEAAEPRRVRFVPAWALAAAASLLVVAGAAALANLEVRVGSDGLVVRTGWGVSATSPDGGAAATPETSRAADAGLAGELRALQQRLRELEKTQAAEITAAVPAAGSVGDHASAAATQAVEARLRRLIAESERRQRTDMALQLAAVWKDFNAVRASDFVRVHESLERVQGQTNLQLRQQRDSLQSLYRISLQK